ncbi:MAG: phosphatase PAP2 family protein [Acidimicrobiales bacterium]
MDRRIYLDVNRFAARTAWAHSVLAFFARPYALAVLVALVVVALVRARVTGFGGSDIDQIAALVWAGIGTAVAYAVSVPVVHLVGRARPFVVIPQAAVLISRPSGFSFPNEHAVIAGAVAAGLWLSRARLVASVATLLAVVIAFAVVYAGTAYPGDALAGLLLGVFVCLALYPFVIGSLRDLAHGLARSPFKFLVGGGHHGGSVGAGPAARPKLVGESGAVRILSQEEVSTRRVRPGGQASPVRILPPEPSGADSILPLEETGGVRIIPPEETGAGSGAGTGRG